MRPSFSARLPLLAASLTLLGVSCASTPRAELPTVAPTSPPASVSSTGTLGSPVAAEMPYYVAYTKDGFDAARAAGRPIVLYFWAGWCPICIAEEPTIRQTVEGMDVPLAGFRVNYDTESALKSTYKIPYQHTMVILDREGKEIERFLGPQPIDAYRAAFRRAAE